jgi:hypothetical protein
MYGTHHVQVRELIGLAGRTGKPLQRFYPQCQRCSIKQATAMRSGKRVLVLHLHAPRYRSEHMAGGQTGALHGQHCSRLSVRPAMQPSQPVNSQAACLLPVDRSYAAGKIPAK